MSMSGQARAGGQRAGCDGAKQGTMIGDGWMGGPGKGKRSRPESCGLAKLD